MRPLGVTLLFWGQRQIEEGRGWLFAPLASLFACVVYLRNFLYDRKFLPVTRVCAVVVSVGNIVAGGAGKTPLVHLLAKLFSHRRVAILSRGYGKVADEALLLRQKLPGVPVYVDPDRVRSAKRAIVEGAELLLLDDGFQHRRLARDFDLVMLRGSDRGGHFLPWGFLRDDPKRVKEADLVVSVGPPFAKEAQVRMAKKGVGEFPWRRKRVALFCAIAHPKNFEEMVAGEGGQVVARLFLADHEVPREGNLRALAHCAQALGAEVILCTEKDAVKLPLDLSLPLPIIPLPIELEVVEGRGEWQKFIEKIERTVDHRAHGKKSRSSSP